MPGANFGATFGTLRGRNPDTGSKLHISRIVVASILLFGGSGFAWSQEQIGGRGTRSLIMLRAILRLEIKCPLFKATMCS